MNENKKLGGILGIIGGLMGIIGHMAIFLKWYIPGMMAEAAEPGCEILLKYFNPAMADLGILGGVLFLMIAVGKRSVVHSLLGLLLGMAWVFCLMNGIASLSRIITIGAPFYTLVQRLHWIAMLGWGTATVGIIIKPKEWMRVVGITAGVLEVVVGFPLANMTAIELGRFSLFSLAPISSLILVILLVIPSVWKKIEAMI